jgi:hypothetical protein
MNTKDLNTPKNTALNDSWLSAPEDLSQDLCKGASYRVTKRIAQGLFTHGDISNIYARKLEFIERSLDLTPTELTHARRLCQLCDVRLKDPSVTSHRRIIGPIIVSVKRLLFPLLRALLQDTLKQQRDFNAALVEAYVDSCQKQR